MKFTNSAEIFSAFGVPGEMAKGLAGFGGEGFWSF